MRITASRGGAQPSALVGRVNRREVSAAPPKVAPAGAITVQVAASRILTGGMQLTGGLSGTLAALRPLEESVKLAAEMVNFETQSGSTVGGLPGVANFVIMRPGEIFNPVAGVDSVEATRFKAALSQTFETMQQSARAGTPPPRTAIDLDAVASEAATALDPAMTITRRVKALIEVPPQVGEEVGDGFVEPMAYPEIDSPMFEPLAKLSPELFLPNINLISPNSVTLVEANRPFIEAYMVGLNHEMSRELLWNEFPTDQRGSYFRQFWNVAGVAPPNGDPDKLRDIREIHAWIKRLALGHHSARPPLPGGEERLVLLVRGDLFRRYPNTEVYALKALADPSGKRSLGADRVDYEFYGKLLPDVAFFGFPLTPTQAVGAADATDASRDQGWFFVLQEQPAEPRFGLDVGGAFGGAIADWSALSWTSLATNAADLQALTHIDLDRPLPDVHELDRGNEPAWHANSGLGRHGAQAAHLAYITLQQPVRIAIHASDMLRGTR
jgi:hypothetical protein